MKKKSVPNKKNDFCRSVVKINGMVQGIGFRPFIYRIAIESGIKGWVNNSSAGVNIEAEGTKSQLDKFFDDIIIKKPAISVINSFEIKYEKPYGYNNFEIRKSSIKGKKEAFILPDFSTCNDCLEDIFDKENRRYLYPFTNCTNCGPRFSIIERLPYDRSNTVMKNFKMCELCLEEYNNPDDRRFHAQPNACFECGPTLELLDNNGKLISTGNKALIDTCESLSKGSIMAIKGIGGFQLITDAGNDISLLNLRKGKNRSEKPFALMFPDIESVKLYCQVNSAEEKLLLSFQSPIVILKRKKYYGKECISDKVTQNGNPYLGVMLPYSPLHHILMTNLKKPLIATSGNISEEPICIENQEAIDTLKNIAEFFLVHNRKIVRPVDDSVTRIISGRNFVIRMARGYAPLPIPFDTGGNKFFSLGGHLKNTIAFSNNNNIFISQHIGDLNSEKTFISFKKTISSFKEIYSSNLKNIACDFHPDYISSQYAKSISNKLYPVQHHYAHILACMAENQLKGKVLGIAWDGTGLGTDGTIWGGEFIKADEKSFSRFAHFMTFPLPGGEKAVKKPCKTAIGLLFAIYGKDFVQLKKLKTLKEHNFNEIKNIINLLEKKINCPVTSSVGRIFDAISSILGLVQIISFEGQAAISLEFLAEKSDTNLYYNFAIINNIENIPVIIDWRQMILEIIKDYENKINLPIIARKFHNTLVEIIISVSKISGEKRVVLSGGCFQNKLLLENSIYALKKNNFEVFWHSLVPTNDGGISLGQMCSALNQPKEV